MPQRLPPHLQESLRRIEDYCDAIRKYMFKSWHLADEAAKLIESESRAIVRLVEKEKPE